MKKIVFLSMLMFSAFVFNSCQKTELKNNLKEVSLTSYENSVITSAKNFFNNEVVAVNLQFHGTPDERQKLKKTTQWENAEILKNPKVDIVVVPLKFDKTLELNIGGANTSPILLEKQSKLFVYKGEDGKFKAEVVTYIPDKDYLEKKPAKFSGVVIVEDWAGNSINKYLFKKNRIFKIAKNNSATVGRITTDESCLHISWYLCDVDENGFTFNCEYLYTEDIGSCNMGLEPPAEGGYYDDEYIVEKLKTVNWVVDESVITDAYSWRIMSYDRIKGFYSQASNGSGHFVDATHVISSLNNASDSYAVWQETSGSATLEDCNEPGKCQTVISVADGSLSFPTIGLPTRTIHKSRGWSPSQVYNF